MSRLSTIIAAASIVVIGVGAFFVLSSRDPQPQNTASPATDPIQLVDDNEKGSIWQRYCTNAATGSIDLNANTVNRELTLDDDYAPGFSVAEGLVWDGSRLLLSQIRTSDNAARLLSWDGSELLVVREDHNANGMAINAAGKYLLIANHATGAVLRADIDNVTGERSVVIDEHNGARFNSPNDIAAISLDSATGFFFTDPDWQTPDRDNTPQQDERLYYFDGSQIRIANTDTKKPNGVLFQYPNTLWVSGNEEVVRYTFDADAAELSERTVILAEGGDGMTQDCSGNVYVTSGQEVIVFDKDGSQIGAIDPPGELALTNVAFGGANRTTLYISSLGELPELYSVRLPLTGFAD